MRLAAAGALLLLLLAGCPTPPPVVHEQTLSASAGSLRQVVVMPFYPRPELDGKLAAAASPHSAEDVARLVTGFLTEALQAEGVVVVGPSDVALAYEKAGRAVPRRSPADAARFAADEFGASAVMLGEVYRWRERSGAELGSSQPSSVGYELSLHSTPVGRRLWTSRFDETQRPLSEDVRNAARYPGGGSRWLSAAELARWGASASARSLVEGQWRPDSK